MNQLYLLLGSNMGKPEKQLAVARKHLAAELGPIERQSCLYQTAAWGNTNQPDFLNQVIIIETTYSAAECLEKNLGIEALMGRIRTEKNAPRVIDIDILYFNKERINTANLVVPHPAIQDRRFVLTPLNELSPLFVHPVLLRTNHELLAACTDNLDVKKI